MTIIQRLNQIIADQKETIIAKERANRLQIEATDWFREDVKRLEKLVRYHKERAAYWKAKFEESKIA
jgi:hypothetical protein